MTIDELRPYLGQHCHVRLRCRPCGGRHHFFGKLMQGQYIGDITLCGHCYSMEDIEAIWTPEPLDGRRAAAPSGMRWRNLFAGGISGL